MTASAGPGGTWEKPNGALRPASPAPSPAAGQQKAESIPQFISTCLPLPLPDGCLLCSVIERASGSTWVIRDKFSVIHKVEVSDVYQIVRVQTWYQCWAWSNSAKVLGLSKASWHPAGDSRTLWWGWGLRKLPGGSEQSFSGPNRLWFGMKGEFCTGPMCEEKMTPILGPYNILSQILPR